MVRFKVCFRNLFCIRQQMLCRFLWLCCVIIISRQQCSAFTLSSCPSLRSTLYNRGLLASRWSVHAKAPSSARRGGLLEWSCLTYGKLVGKEIPSSFTEGVDYFRSSEHKVGDLVIFEDQGSSRRFGEIVGIGAANEFEVCLAAQESSPSSKSTGTKNGQEIKKLSPSSIALLTSITFEAFSPSKRFPEKSWSEDEGCRGDAPSRDLGDDRNEKLVGITVQNVWREGEDYYRPERCNVGDLIFFPVSDGIVQFGKAELEVSTGSGQEKLRVLSETAVWAPSPDVVSSLTYLPPPPPDSDPPPLPWTASPAGIAKMRLTGALQFEKKMTGEEEEEEEKLLDSSLPPAISPDEQRPVEDISRSARELVAGAGKSLAENVWRGFGFVLDEAVKSAEKMGREARERAREEETRRAAAEAEAEARRAAVEAEARRAAEEAEARRAAEEAEAEARAAVDAEARRAAAEAEARRAASEAEARRAAEEEAEARRAAEEAEARRAASEAEARRAAAEARRAAEEARRAAEEAEAEARRAASEAEARRAASEAEARRAAAEAEARRAASEVEARRAAAEAEARRAAEEAEARRAAEEAEARRAAEEAEARRAAEEAEARRAAEVAYEERRAAEQELRNAADRSVKEARRAAEEKTAREELEGLDGEVSMRGGESRESEEDKSDNRDEESATLRFLLSSTETLSRTRADETSDNYKAKKRKSQRAPVSKGFGADNRQRRKNKSR
ncbi:hypothetical protein GUITHDRAFT_109288 [Guillardia theta CCMP2712]|uniref:Uncharacterized protein n=1 Tax=Guillardia theta (strain CCMP2712) TaxID=905079 RepID=L1J988_GUITC|nr:hypothetical protein GUITHDRAFT_109288 [Guillardia theta CCMP2712]EKX44867.1 hypothetical protein GUITHDRAFT_109288 [Guillardia theta CCMP2712]|eukprot:XP_005831847.1 hypothetical protein GUITHDRAFT_109288 [Guillardia theta CCMP2712]